MKEQHPMDFYIHVILLEDARPIIFGWMDYVQLLDTRQISNFFSLPLQRVVAEVFYPQNNDSLVAREKFGGSQNSKNYRHICEN